MLRLRLSILLVLLAASAPLAHGISGDAHVAVGTADGHVGSGIQCEDVGVYVKILDTDDKDVLHVEEGPLTTTGPRACNVPTFQGSIGGVKGSSLNGWTYEGGCFRLYVGPVGPAAPFELEDLCSDDPLRLVGVVSFVT